MSLNQLQAISFIIEHPSFFFSYGQLLDYHMGQFNISSPHDHLLELLDQLQQSQQHYCPTLLSLFHLLHSQRSDTPSPSLQLNKQLLHQFQLQDGVQILFNVVCRMVENCRSSKDKHEMLRVEMTVKVALNILYLVLRGLEEGELARQILKVDIEEMLMQLIQASLEVNFICIRKVVVLFYLVLKNRFRESKALTVQDVQDLKDNIVVMSMLQAETSSTPRRLIKQPNPIEAFYRGHNINECTLAQYIVVGLLRALLTACNSSTKASSAPTTGVDSFREWRTSFIYAAQIYKGKELPVQMKEMLEMYNNFESSEKKEERSEISNEFDRHRIYTAAAITSFFAFLLIKLKSNTFLQYSYLIQLISDANGILVLLKFLTDKFQLAGIKSISIYGIDEHFFDKVKCTIHNILLLLLTTCNNFSEKIKNFLFDYNSFLILKKLPGLFDEDQRVTELSCYLLKIQIPFFTKKMKEVANNMKMIAEIYCKYPQQPNKMEKPTPYQRLMLKNKIKASKSKQVVTIEQIKDLHTQFNNYNYWHVEVPIQQPAVDYLQRLEAQVQLQPILKENYEKWLEENVWGYYD